MVSGVLLCIIPLFIQCSLAEPVPNARNVMMIVVDDLSPRINAHPYSQHETVTPNIDRLIASAGAVSFRSAYTVFPVCGPSRAAFMTGLRPTRTNIIDNKQYFRNAMGPALGKDVITLPQWFKLNGFVTHGAGKTFHPGSASGAWPGCATSGGDMPYSWTGPYWFCDQYYNGTLQSPPNVGYPAGHGSGCMDPPEEHCQACMQVVPTSQPAINDHPCNNTCYPDGAVAAQALRLLAARATAPSARWFLALGFKRPHLGWFAPSAYYNLFNSTRLAPAAHPFPPENVPAQAYQSNNNSEACGMQDISSSCSVRTIRTHAGPAFEFRQVDASLGPSLRRGYYAAVSYMDSQLGAVLDALDTSPFVNNTAIVLFGDHGYHLGEQGEWAKQTLFEAGTRIPLVVVPPKGFAAGTAPRASTAIVESVDIYPTLVDLAGLPMPPSIGSNVKDGVSLVPLLGTQGASRDIHYNVSWSQMGPSWETQRCSIRVNGWRAVTDCPWASYHAERDELYNHHGDDGSNFDLYERVNVAMQHSDVMRDFRQRILSGPLAHRTIPHTL